MLVKDYPSKGSSTQLAFICMRLLGTPCWCLLSMLAFILYKNTQLSALQITVIVALKPASSLLSPYWTQAIYQRPDRILANLMGANFLRHLLFLFIPLIPSPWFVIFAFGVYMTLTRATIPGWMELFKHNLPQQAQAKLVGYGTAIDFLGTAVLSVVIGLLLDTYPHIWKGLFAMTAALGFLSTFLLATIPNQHAPSAIVSSITFKESVVRPWKHIWQVMIERRDFALFQLGFMLAGAGLMIMQPALPKLFIDVFHLSFTEMGIAIAFCKGIGVALTSSLWTRFFQRTHIFQLSSLVALFAMVFPFLLLATFFHISWLYLAYAFYGIMQAGSELSWHMSALVFAKEKDSSIFSTTNVMTVGARGCIVPALGSMLLPFIHPIGVIVLGALLCLFASLYFRMISRTAVPEKRP